MRLTACKPSKLKANSASPHWFGRFLIFNVFCDNATNRLFVVLPTSPNPALNTATIESQQQVNKRRDNFLAASRRSLYSGCSVATVCKCCQSDRNCDEPNPPASCSISTSAHRASRLYSVDKLLNGFDEIMLWYSSQSQPVDRYTKTPVFCTEVTNCCSDRGISICSCLEKECVSNVYHMANCSFCCIYIVHTSLLS